MRNVIYNEMDLVAVATAPRAKVYEVLRLPIICVLKGKRRPPTRVLLNVAGETISEIAFGYTS